MKTSTKNSDVKVSIRHDSLSISGKFKSGANFKFKIGRNGETLSLAFSNDTNELKEQTKIFFEYLKFRGDETNLDRINRLEKLCDGCSSGKELINKMQKQNFNTSISLN